MTKTILRKRIHQYIDQVDESMLTIVYQLLEREVNSSEYTLTSAEKRQIDQRISNIHSGNDKGVSAIAVSKNIRAKLKSNKK